MFEIVPSCFFHVSPTVRNSLHKPAVISDLTETTIKLKTRLKSQPGVHSRAFLQWHETFPLFTVMGLTDETSDFQKNHVFVSTLVCRRPTFQRDERGLPGRDMFPISESASWPFQAEFSYVRYLSRKDELHEH